MPAEHNPRPLQLDGHDKTLSQFTPVKPACSITNNNNSKYCRVYSLNKGKCSHSQHHSLTALRPQGRCSSPFPWPWAGSELQTQLSYVGGRPHLSHILPLPSRAFRPVPKYTAWWQRHVCEQLAQSRYLAVERLGIEPATFRTHVRHCILFSTVNRGTGT